MTDDELLVLWTLSGSWGWKNILEFIKKRDDYWMHWNEHPNALLFSSNFGYFELNEEIRFVEWYKGHIEHVEILYVLEDPITFVPSQRWLKLLLAKHWYQNNKERFE